MGTRILTFHKEDTIANGARLGATFYIETDYTPITVRIHAEDAPFRDAKFDIFDDGVSIFANRSNRAVNSAGQDITPAALTAAVLGAGLNTDELAGDFESDVIEEGSWVHCEVPDNGGGRNFTVELELFSGTEPAAEEL